MHCCKFCGSTEGFYTKNRYEGIGIYRFNFDGSEADNTEMYNSLSVTQSKYVYCSSCNKRLFKTEELQLD